jgi:rod shape-determining protein MreD
MRNAAVIAIGVALLLVQGNLFRLIGGVDMHGFAPNLVLPLIVFLGVHEGAMARGALLAFGLGYATDLFGSAPIGLFTFSSVAIWWLSRVTAVRLSAQTVPTQVFLASVFSLIESSVVLTLLAIFGVDSQRPVEIATVVFPRAIATGLVSPLVFRIAQRLYQGTSVAPRSAETGGG